MTKKEIMEARGMWHTTKVVVVLASSFVGSGKGLSDIYEAHCICRWAESYFTHEAADKAAKKHSEEMNG